MFNKKMVITTLVLGLVFGFVGYIYGENINSMDAHQTHNHSEDVIEVHASWIEGSKSIEELVKTSDIVLVGSIEEEVGAYQPFMGYEDTFTDAKIKVQQILKGTSEEDIIISQYGGVRRDGKLELFHHLPLLNKGKKHLFFLTKIEDNTLRNGKYQYTNGIEGLYAIEDDNLLSDVETIAVNKIKNKKFKQLVKEIKEMEKLK
jgi:hypothetical protein